jgi:sulfur carrier protein
MITVILSGKKKNYEKGTTVAKLLELENVEMPEYVSVSINDEFVRSDSFSQTVLNDGDTVELLYFMGGGK